MLPEIKKPLVFGDLETIKAIKETERIKEFNELPDCSFCVGDGECDKCGTECLKCDGVGKDFEALQTFKAKYPNWRLKL